MRKDCGLVGYDRRRASSPPISLTLPSGNKGICMV